MTDQRDVIGFLESPSAHDGQPVERIDTHASIVFLAGQRALKMKRAVRFDYLDFSTLERRHRFCDAEVRINRRTAPQLYRGVLPITRDAAGRLTIGGEGEPVEWVVEMRQFDQSQLFDRLASANQLTLDVMAPLGRHIAHFHDQAAARPDHGGRAGMSWVIEGNATDLAERGRGLVDEDACQQLTDRSRASLDVVADLLDARRDAGDVRECHGDLHLRNIVLLDHTPTLFDAIEFNDELSCVDVFYDLAFLLMDLWRQRLTAHANAVFNAYLEERSDLAGLSLLPLFLACRAAVRAKTSVTAARQQQQPSVVADLARLASTYLELAMRLLQPPAPAVVAIGGLSGTGKSTVSRILAPMIGAVPGAVIVRSDVERKRLFHVAPDERLGEDAYRRDISERVYHTVIRRAAAAVGYGHSVIVDAVFARPEDRAGIEEVARDAGVPFHGVWLYAPVAVSMDRVRARMHDVSDATPAVVQGQAVAHHDGAIRWTRVDAAQPLEAVVQSVRARCGADRAYQTT